MKRKFLKASAVALAGVGYFLISQTMNDSDIVTVAAGWVVCILLFALAFLLLHTSLGPDASDGRDGRLGSDVLATSDYDENDLRRVVKLPSDEIRQIEGEQYAKSVLDGIRCAITEDEKAGRL